MPHPSPRPRVSILGLIGLVSLSAVGLAAVRAESELWASGLYTLLVLALLVSAVGIFGRRGRRRAWWAGFATFAGGYALVSFGPWAHQGVGTPMLLPTQLLLRYELDGAPPEKKSFSQRPRVEYPGRDAFPSGAVVLGPPHINHAAWVLVGESACLHQTIHGIMALLLGLAGAQLAAVLWTPEEDREAISAPPDPTRAAGG